MTESWTELWSLGTGASRTYCGIVRTEEGFAVDVFVGDTCVESHESGTGTDAAYVAAALKDQYRRLASVDRVRLAAIDFVLPPSSTEHRIARAV